nr:MAG TPA: hypothetical protein [Crassvirales sp.]
MRVFPHFYFYPIWFQQGIAKAIYYGRSNIMVIEIIKTIIILFKTMIILYKEWQGRSNIIIS